MLSAGLPAYVEQECLDQAEGGPEGQDHGKARDESRCGEHENGQAQEAEVEEGCEQAAHLTREEDGGQTDAAPAEVEDELEGTDEEEGPHREHLEILEQGAKRQQIDEGGCRRLADAEGYLPCPLAVDGHLVPTGVSCLAQLFIGHMAPALDCCTESVVIYTP